MDLEVAIATVTDDLSQSQTCLFNIEAARRDIERGERQLKYWIEKLNSDILLLDALDGSTETVRTARKAWIVRIQKQLDQME